MSSEALNLDEIGELIIDGDIEGVRSLATRALEAGIEAHTLITDHLVPAMEEVGRMFECGDYFVSEMLVSARAADTLLKLAEPYLAQGDHQPAGLVVMGTVKGDMHDIGKNIVSMMLKGNGFKVVDLGADAGSAKFVQAIQEHDPDIIGMSALLTTTMSSMSQIVEALNKAGLREQVKVMIGGAPITQQFATTIGADGFASDAAAAVRLAHRLMEQKRG